MSEDKLKVFFVRIVGLDEQIQALISERARCALDAAALKNGSDAASFYRPEREAEVLRRVIARNQGPLGGEEMARLFREIMSAYLGPEGTFTQVAARKHFGHSVSTVAHNAIDEVFRDVEAGACHYGVVPVENSTEGVVTHTLDMFLNSPLKIVGEVQLRIHHNLLGRVDGLSSIQRVYAHQQTQTQCREWLDENLAGIERIAVSSNAEAARRVTTETNAAAIASREAANIYGLRAIASNIEDEPDNTTRFLVIGREAVARSGRDKTSLLVSAPNRPGALHDLLAPFAEHGISMTRIESRPARRGVWEYVFFVDIEGHSTDAAVGKALGELGAAAAMLKVLGSYPRAVL